MYVLIITTLFGGSVYGLTTTTQEFQSASACENARIAIHQMTGTAPDSKYIKTVCVSKEK
jgi:hypothetical protein